MIPISKIDISENTLRNRGSVLDILLRDRTSRRNIIWATDSYKFSPTTKIKKEQITGANGKIIQPRAAKSKEEQKCRTKDKAEVFTPLKIVKEMNMAINKASKNWPTNKENWIAYISELRLEITCGEAPFISSRYDPTRSASSVVSLNRRVGFLDYKLRVLGNYVKSKQDWLKYAEIALKSSYGYEWQGDNLLIARENILQTMEDFYKDFCSNKLKLKSRQGLSDEQLEYFAKIISWNIWQMDGLKYVRPMSCKDTVKKIELIDKNQTALFKAERPTKIKIECEGCRINDPSKHTGQYILIKDWTNNGKTGKNVRFVDLLNND